MESIGQTSTRLAVIKPRSVTVEVRRKRVDKTKFTPPQPVRDCLVNDKSEYIASICEDAIKNKSSDSTLQELIRAKDTPRYIGVSKSTYHNYRNRNSKYFDSSFPALIAISLHCKGHLKHELNTWLECKKVNRAGLGGDNG